MHASRHKPQLNSTCPPPFLTSLLPLSHACLCPMCAICSLSMAERGLWWPSRGVAPQASRSVVVDSARTRCAHLRSHAFCGFRTFASCFPSNKEAPTTPCATLLALPNTHTHTNMYAQALHIPISMPLEEEKWRRTHMLGFRGGSSKGLGSSPLPQQNHHHHPFFHHHHASSPFSTSSVPLAGSPHLCRYVGVEKEG